MFEKDFRLIDGNSLHAATLRAAKNEKAATLELLEYLAEIDLRRLYSEWAYSSLFEYVHKALGYSEAQSSERVSAMRLLRRVPEVKVALEKGTLTLTSTAKLASHVRREKSSREEALLLLEQCEGKATREVERVLVSNSTQMEPTPEKVRAITPSLTRVTLEVDEEFMALVTRMRENDGNPALSMKEVFQLAMREYVKRREVKPSTSRTASRTPEVKRVSVSRSPAFRSRYIPISIRNQIRLRSGDRCEYRDPTNQRRCESRSGLELDHILPYGKGGTNDVENLRHACPSHNLFHAIGTYGEAKMKPYLRE